MTPGDFSASRLLLHPRCVWREDGFAEGLGVLVEDGRFAAVAPVEELAARGLEAVELPDHALLPGFVDSHTHLSQGFGKALAFGEPSEIFRRIWVPLESHLDEETVFLSAKLAALEALRGGFTSVVDAGTRHETGAAIIAQATREAGLRCVLGLICNDLGQDPAPILARAEQHLARWSGMVVPSLAVSIPELGTDATMARLAALCLEAGVPFQTHANEHLVAVERSIVARGLRPVEHLHAAGALNPAALLAHATLLTARELGMLRDSGAAVAYCPVATQWKGNAAAPALMMQEMGIRFGLGTDATRADGFRLLDAAEAVQRQGYGIAQGDFSQGAGWTWLEAATSGAAAVSGLPMAGRVAPGCVADFLLVGLEVPELVPSRDLAWELVRFGNRDQIMAVFTDGVLRLWQGWPVGWDGRALMREVRQRVAAAVAKAPIVKLHAGSAAHRRAWRPAARPRPARQAALRRPKPMRPARPTPNRARLIGTGASTITGAKPPTRTCRRSLKPSSASRETELIVSPLMAVMVRKFCPLPSA